MRNFLYQYCAFIIVVYLTTMKTDNLEVALVQFILRVLPFSAVSIIPSLFRHYSLNHYRHHIWVSVETVVKFDT
jgi:hypothetical protein